MIYEDLPGGDILSEGLSDLSRGKKTPFACLLLVGAPRLARHGIILPVCHDKQESAEEFLYDLLYETNGAEAYRIYNALIDRLVSLENALDLVASNASAVQLQVR